MDGRHSVSSFPLAGKPIASRRSRSDRLPRIEGSAARGIMIDDRLGISLAESYLGLSKLFGRRFRFRTLPNVIENHSLI